MFQIGDKVVHPMHGAGVVDSIVQKKVDGVMRDYYVLKLPVRAMLVMIPVDNSDEIGVRPIVDRERANQVLEAMASLKVDMTQNWNRRYRENMERLKTGDPRQVAVVIRTLQRREKTGRRSLPTGERKMLNVAKKILVSELSLALGEEYQKIEHIIEQILV